MSVARQVGRLLEQTINATAAVQRRHGLTGVFVLGGPRTGTADLAEALQATPWFWYGGETNFFHALIGADAQGRSRLYEAYRQDRSSGQRPRDFRKFARHVGRGLEGLFQSRSRNRRWLDSAHENVLVAQDLAYLFPTARFIHLVRDGRAVVRSALTADPSWVRWAPDMRSAVAIWSHYTRAGLDFEKHLPQRVLRVRAEDLVAAPSGATARILQFLEAEPSEAAADYIELQGMSASYMDEPPRQHGRLRAFDVPVDGDWESWTPEDQAVFTEVAAEPMRQLGYWAETKLARHQSVGL